jgi:hypothetical protein
MKKIIIFLFVVFSNFCFSQYLKGRVIDTSNQPLPGATVYYDGTTLATLTMDTGEFMLPYDSKLNRPIVISYIGYQTVFIENYKIDDPLEIVMEIAVNSLREVVIQKDKFSRKDKMKVFKERFLGTTSFGRKTIIQNENDIEFEYDQKTFVLKAYSDKPLIIINPSLGYKITFELVDFETKFSYLSILSNDVIQSYFSGLSRYEEIDNNPKKIKQREKAYKGSNVHFFRNLINGVWGKDDFQLFEKSYLTNPTVHFTVTFEEDRYRVAIKKQKLKSSPMNTVIAIFNLLYDNKEQSSIQFKTDTIFIDQYGNNLSLREVSFSGAISIKCVGDMLPLNYGL